MSEMWWAKWVQMLRGSSATLHTESNVPCTHTPILLHRSLLDTISHTLHGQYAWLLLDCCCCCCCCDCSCCWFLLIYRHSFFFFITMHTNKLSEKCKKKQNKKKNDDSVSALLRCCLCVWAILDHLIAGIFLWVTTRKINNIFNTICYKLENTETLSPH